MFFLYPFAFAPKFLLIPITMIFMDYELLRKI